MRNNPGMVHTHTYHVHMYIHMYMYVYQRSKCYHNLEIFYFHSPYYTCSSYKNLENTCTIVNLVQGRSHENFSKQTYESSIIQDLRYIQTRSRSFDKAKQVPLTTFTYYIYSIASPNTSERSLSLVNENALHYHQENTKN